MSMVFKHYPEGGSEMLLALALADFSNDTGTQIYPSVAALAKKTRQSIRSVQYQLQKMIANGFLTLVEAGGREGKKYRANEYRINLSFFQEITAKNEAEIRGAKVAPLPATQADTSDTGRGATFAPLKSSENDDISARGAIWRNQGCNLAQSGVQSGAIRGAIATAPQPPYTTTITTTTVLPGSEKSDLAEAESPPEETVVVVDDLIFPPQTTQEQRKAIVSEFERIGLGTNDWQAILDELHGAQLSRTIKNPIGYARSMACRAAARQFHLEAGEGIAKQREMLRHLEATDETNTHPADQQSDDPSKLPFGIRSALERIRSNKLREASK